MNTHQLAEVKVRHMYDNALFVDTKMYMFSSPIHYSVILFTHLSFGYRLNYIKGSNGVS